MSDERREAVDRALRQAIGWAVALIDDEYGGVDDVKPRLDYVKRTVVHDMLIAGRENPHSPVAALLALMDTPEEPEPVAWIGEHVEPTTIRRSYLGWPPPLDHNWTRVIPLYARPPRVEGEVVEILKEIVRAWTMNEIAPHHSSDGLQIHGTFARARLIIEQEGEDG